jgi:dipeptidase
VLGHDQLRGRQGLWVAERIGPDDIRASYPGYIKDVPENYQEDPNWMGSDNLMSFAIEQGWYDPAGGEPFNVHEVYGTQGVPAREPRAKFMSQKKIEEELRAMAPVSVDEMMTMVRDQRIADDEAGYGQVAELREGVPSELALLWVAPTGSVTAPFIPWRIGVQEVPPEFGQHRYLTKGAASTFLDPEFQAQEATQFAGRVFKRLMYSTCEHPQEFLPEVTEALEAFEARLQDDQGTVEATALSLLESGEDELARRYLTFYANTKAMDGLRLGEALLAGIEARTKAIYGIRKPGTDQINSQGGETVNCLVGQDPDQPS